MTKEIKSSIVFAHGLWADGSCFRKLIPALQADGHEVICSQHGLDSLKSDVDCVTRCFGRVSGPAVIQLKLSRASCPETIFDNLRATRKGMFSLQGLAQSAPNDNARTEGALHAEVHD